MTPGAQGRRGISHALDTVTLNSDRTGIAEAARLLRAGSLVAIPTETVYGLAADATNPMATAAIYNAKGRPAFNPLIVHVTDARQARSLVHWTDEADRLTKAFWPGALTLVLPARSDSPVCSLARAGLPSLAVRCPDHDIAREIIALSGCPLAAPSANPSGKITATTAGHVAAGLTGRIAAVVDAGACAVGVESTIVGLTDKPRLLRPGGLPREAVEETLQIKLTDAGEAITAPGQMSSHYAPEASVRLEVTTPRDDEVLLGFGPVAGDLSLSPSGDLTEAAARLFDCLHQLNESGQPIAVAPIPRYGLGLAINDRLARAAAPR